MIGSNVNQLEWIVFRTTTTEHKLLRREKQDEEIKGRYDIQKCSNCDSKSASTHYA